MRQSSLERLQTDDYLYGSLRRNQRLLQQAEAALSTEIDEATAGPIFRTVTATGSLQPSSDEILLLDATVGAFVFTLTTPLSADGERVRFTTKFLATNGNAVMFQPASGQIDGQANLSISGAMQTFDIAWDGANWHTL